jgi:hypothetical protein
VSSSTPARASSQAQNIPLMPTDEFKAALEKAKGTNTTYTPPTATRP